MVWSMEADQMANFTMCNPPSKTLFHLISLVHICTPIFEDLWRVHFKFIIRMFEWFNLTTSMHEVSKLFLTVPSSLYGGYKLQHSFTQSFQALNLFWGFWKLDEWWFQNACLVDSRLGCCFGGIINHNTHMFPSLKILAIGILRPITHDQPEKSCEDFSWVFFHPRCATVP